MTFFSFSFGANLRTRERVRLDKSQDSGGAVTSTLIAVVPGRTRFESGAENILRTEMRHSQECT